jgi:phosphatidylglycerol:prolipoprotein diacylglycerol transferase
MFDFYTQIGSFTLQTFTVLVAVGVLLSGAVGLLIAKGHYARLADVYLCALLVGMIGARLGHVWLSPAHFAYNPAEIFQLSAGGLDWHGGVLGALIGVALGVRWRKLNPHAVLDTLTFALPLICFFTWAGCSVAACAYGQEVETLAYYPPLIVHEAPTVYGGAAPRYHTQLLGMALAVIAIFPALMLFFRGKGKGRRFWGVLALVSLGMFGLGFLRADAAEIFAGLRQDQWLDLLILLIAGVGFIWAKRPPLPLKLS